MPWHNKHGIIHRIRECYWVLTGKWSLHRAWQAGLDEGTRSEYHRLITRSAFIGELKAREIPAYSEVAR
jgi:hypothetical protein